MTDTLHKIAEWFKRAVPNPTAHNQSVQIGCHIEEIAEMFAALHQPQTEAYLSKYAKAYKTAPAIVGRQAYNDRELLDSLCDQIVTAVGVAHMLGYDIHGALAEVNNSNWSKFEDGEPVFDANMKITKGRGYKPPELGKFLKNIEALIK